MLNLIIIYMVAVVTHFIFQTATAIHYHTTPDNVALRSVMRNVRVLAIIPVYKEDKETLHRTIISTVESLQGFEYQVVVVNNDPTNQEYFDGIPYSFHNTSLINIDQQGKRDAQQAGFNYAKNDLSFTPDFVLTTDSDTIIHKDAVKELYKKFCSDENLGAVTGQVLANKVNHWMNKIISLRYFLAFNQERASQSVFNQVQCCSGPLTMYRADIFEKLMTQYVGQTFMGERCTFGDDRHLTSLVLSEGYGTAYASKALAYTDTPETFKKLVKQQLRWSKSYWRETFLALLLTTKVQGKVKLFTLWETIINLVLPIALFINLLYIVCFRSINEGFSVVLQYLFIIIIVALIRSVFGLVFDNYNKKWEYLWLPVFAVLNIIVFLPLRIYALFTLTKNKWGTR